MGRKIFLLLSVHGNLEQARAVTEKLPAAYLLDDRGAVVASEVWLLTHQWDECIASLTSAHDYLQTNSFVGPKAYRTGLANQKAGRTEAAKTDWRTALQVVEQRLAAQPNAPVEMGWKACLLALLGERAEAQRVLRVCEQLNSAQQRQMNFSAWMVYALLGREGDVLAGLESGLKRPNDARWVGMQMRYNPELDPVRSSPRFQELMKLLPAMPSN
jgi:hypothetical protein